MPELIKIPFNKEIFEELDDAIIDEKITVDEFILSLIKDICRDAKMSKLNKSIQATLIKNGQRELEQIKLKGIELKELPFDSKWIPDNLDKEDIVYFEREVSNKIMKYLELAASFVNLRHEKYYESLKTNNEELIKTLILQKVPKEQLEQANQASKLGLENIKRISPKCVEHTIHSSLEGIIQKKILENIDKEFAKESEPKVEEKKADAEKTK